MIKFGKSDGIGFAIEYFYCDRALTLVFLKWYMIIEKDWNKVDY